MEAVDIESGSEAPSAGSAAARPRDVGLDALRGITILLVVLSHALQDHPAPGGAALWQVLWYVDMPLFVLLAGFAFGYARQRPFWTQVARRARQLLIPYVVWGLLLGLLFKSGLTAERAWGVVVNTFIGRAGPWFLLALFVFEVILLGMRRLTARAWGLLALGFGVVCLVAVVRTLVPGLDHMTNRTVFDTQKYFLFYVVGYVASVQAAVWVRHRRIAVIVSAVLLPAALAFKHLGGLPAFTAILDAAALPGRGVITWAIGYAAQVAISLSACVLAFAAIRRIDPKRLFAFAYVGSLSLGVYLIHIWLRGALTGTGWLWVVAAFVFGTGASLVASALISRQPLLNALLLGGRPPATRRAS